MNSGIYLIKNIVNGKVYVGSTKDFKERKRTHFLDLRNNRHYNPHLQNAFNKYGEKNFEYYIVAYCTEDRLVKREDFYMRHFDSTNRKRGYNIETAERHTLSEETKKKIAISVSKVRAGKKHSEETKIKISGALTGKNNPNYGKTKSKETKGKISTSVHLFLTENPRKISEEQKIKISNSLKKSPYSNLGKLMSEEQKSKISRSVSKSMKGKIKSNEHKKNLSIALKKYYNSLPNPTKSLPHLTRN